MRTNGWAIIRPPVGGPGLYLNARVRHFQLAFGAQGHEKVTPVFSSLEKAQQFALVIHAAGFDMTRYEVGYVTGLEGRAEMNLDAHNLVGRVKGDLRPS